MSQSDWVRIFIDLLTALGTLAVAAAAIWGEAIRAAWAPAKLKLVEHNFAGHRNLATTSAGRQFNVIYYHLKVINEKRHLPVKNCRVLLRSMTRRGPDNLFHPCRLVVPCQFVWAPSSTASDMQTVSNEQVLDLGLIREGDEAFRPALYSTPHVFDGYVKAGEAVRYELSIEGEGYSSRKYQVFEVAWGGSFDPSAVRIREVHGRR